LLGLWLGGAEPQNAKSGVVESVEARRKWECTLDIKGIVTSVDIYVYL
jgi:hypothetical protein